MHHPLVRASILRFNTSHGDVGNIEETTAGIRTQNMDPTVPETNVRPALTPNTTSSTSSMNQSIRGRPRLIVYRRHTTTSIGNKYGFRSSIMRFEESRQISVNEYEDPTAIVAHASNVVSQTQEEHQLAAIEPHAEIHSDNSEMDEMNVNDLAGTSSTIDSGSNGHNIADDATRNRGERSSRAESKAVDATPRHGKVTEGTFKCRSCEISFSTQQAHQRHMRVRHSLRSVFKCSIPNCSKTFGEQTHLERHRANVHSNEEPRPKEQVGAINKTRASKRFKCQFATCAKTFAKVCELKRHINGAHTREIVYKCPKCSREFSYACSMKAHLRKRHTRGGNQS